MHFFLACAAPNFHAFNLISTAAEPWLASGLVVGSWEETEVGMIFSRNFLHLDLGMKGFGESSVVAQRCVGFGVVAMGSRG